jgi:hypothetical protein
LSSPHAIRALLDQLNPQEASLDSMLNHHANGMDYLCLHRSPQLTVKLYLLHDAGNENNGWLVNPHSHRYSFESTVLAGAIRHIRFRRQRGREWQEHRYNPDRKAMKPGQHVGLDWQADLHRPGSSYFVDPTEIHTLQVVEEAGPTLIALHQFADVKEDTELYLRPGEKPMMPDYRRPTVAQVEELAARCMALLS